MPETKRTIVQHSGFGYAGKPGWERAVETRAVNTAAEARMVEKVGGILFDTYGEAEDFADKINDAPGMAYPNVAGTFSDKTIDGLRIYIPVRKVVG